MRAVQHVYVVTQALLVLQKSIAHSARRRCDKCGVFAPAVDNTPRECLVHLAPFDGAPQLVQTRAGRTARVLRILRERHDALDTIGFHCCQGIVGKWRCIAKCNVEAMRRRFG